MRRSRLKIILLYLHHNSAFTQNLGLTLKFDFCKNLNIKTRTVKDSEIKKVLGG